MISVKRFEDPTAFRKHVEPFLLEHEATHNVPLGIAAGLERDLHAYGEETPILLCAESGAEVVAVAFRTPRSDYSTPEDRSASCSPISKTQPRITSTNKLDTNH
ncbi:MAG: hypothetical protein ACYDCC_07275 [Actinomycetota bacterium]